MKHTFLKITVAVLLAAFTSATGCGTMTDTVTESIATYGKGNIIEDMHSFHDTGGGWAAAAVEALYRFHGIDVSQKVVASRIYNRSTGQASFGLIARDAELHGLETVMTSGEGILDYVSMGLPVLVLSQVGSPVEDTPPWIVVIGYDEVTGMVVCSAGKRIVISFAAFADIVRLNGGEALVVAPPGRLTREVYLSEAARAHYRGDFMDAINLYRGVLDREKDVAVRASVYLRLADSWTAWGNAAAAVEACRQAVDIKPDDGDNWRGLAQAVMQESGNASLAVPILEKAIAASPARKTYYYSDLGQIYSGAGELTLARGAYEDALRADIPVDAPAGYEAALLIRLAEVEEELGYYQKGRHYREKALRK